MRDLWLYERLSRLSWLNYRAKIMVMAFLGTHIPLIAIIAFYAARTATDWREAAATVGVALGATLAGTGATLFVLNHLLRPVLMTSKALGAYRASRQLPALPTGFTDEAGTLMADAQRTLTALEATLSDLEYIDPATGLANRRKFLRNLSDRAGAGAPFAVCVVHVENLGRIAATFDSHVADEIVRRIVERSRGRVGEGCRLARVDGDTLAFLAVDAADAEAAWAGTARRIADILQASSGEIALAEGTFVPALRGGLALYPDDAASPETLLDHAVAAGRIAGSAASVSFHAPGNRKAARDRFVLEQDLRRAVDEEEFTLHYQPVVDLALGRAVGAEALIRWQHPERGMVSPADFIPAAEASGLIDPIGLWVMRSACDQIRAWNNAGLGDLKVAINLSARQFLDPNLTDFVKAAVLGSGIGSGQLEIELTETAAMVDHAHTRLVFGRLRDLGVSIAIDDFGTGYASMSYLRKLPFDKLKIDREFVTNVHQARDSQAICSALVELAKGLNLEILAEGTETEAEVRHLSERGCRLFQGFYFARPLAAAAFPEAIGNLSISARAMHAAAGQRVA